MLWNAASATERRRTPPSQIAGLADGRAVFQRAFAAGMRPPPRRTVADWAAEKRQVAAESGSPFPGRWDNARAPYMVEVMECLTPSHPAREVVLAKSHQVAGTEAAINLVGYCIDHEPAAMLYVLPSLDEGKKFVKMKLQPTIDATPALRAKVREQKSRDEDGSTTAFKKFRGGFLQVTGANSSKGLQMISVRVLICDEVSEWPDDVDHRGDPLTLAEKRTTAYSEVGYKRFYLSTTGIKGTCRITKKYEASDQRLFYVPCPGCGAWQVLEWKNLKWKSAEAPHGAFFVCPANGCVIEHHEKLDMVSRGAWIRTYPGEDAPPRHFPAEGLARYRSRPARGREPGFHIWQAYSPFVSWDDTVADWLKAEGNPHKVKVFTQQVLGEAFEETGEAPDHEKLFLRRESYPTGRLPPGALVLTGFTDVQGNRLEWGVYGWGVGLTGWLVDKGVIEGDPAGDDVWRRLDEIMARQYEDWQGRTWPVEAWGVDAGYQSHRVYLFCRGRPRVFAMDGLAGPLRPMLGTPRKVDINWRGQTVKGGCMLWPTGTHPVKSDVYARLRRTLDGPDADGNWPMGCLRYPDACDQDYFKQLTAEYLRRGEKNGREIQEWVKAKDQPNEALDILVGARALAYHLGLDNYTVEKWRALAAERGAPPEQTQRDLAELWSAASAAKEARAAAAPPPPPRRVIHSPYMRRA